MKYKCKKTISAALLCFILITQFYACTSNDNMNENPKNPGNPINVVSETADVFYASKEIADAIMAVYKADELPAMRCRYSGADENGENYFEPDEFGILITGIPSPVEEMVFVE